MNETISIPIGSAAEKFFVSYADVAKTKTESLQLLSTVKNENGLAYVIGELLYYSTRFPYSNAFGVFSMLIVEKMKDHKLNFNGAKEIIKYKLCFDFALRMVDDSETHLYEVGERLLAIGWSEDLRSELKQIIDTMGTFF
jgi:hypothetical protein